jgi:hypothetical protein
MIGLDETQPLDPDGIATSRRTIDIRENDKIDEKAFMALVCRRDAEQSHN